MGLHVYTAMYLRLSLIWDVTQRKLAAIYRHFGTAYRSHLQGSSSPRRWER
jgi:hypothetical protein